MPNQIIDVLIVIDAEAIIEQLPLEADRKGRTHVSSDVVYMLTRSNNGLSVDPSPTLLVRVGDVIRWRATTPSFNQSYSVLLCNFEANPNDFISPAQPRVTEVNRPYPSQEEPYVPQRQIVIGHYWGSDVLKRKKMVRYSFNFMILDRDNQVLGDYNTSAFLRIKF